MGHYQSPGQQAVENNLFAKCHVLVKQVCKCIETFILEKNNLSKWLTMNHNFHTIFSGTFCIENFLLATSDCF